MNILSISCHNLYMFKNLSLDFTYKEKNNQEISKLDYLFPESKVKVRKRLILLGGNASGKTTFGKLLCAINNYVAGRDLKSSSLNLFHAIYDKKSDASFEIDFVISRNFPKEKRYFAYRIGSCFNENRIKHEFLKVIRIYKSYTIDKIRNKLSETPNLLEYTFHDYEAGEEVKEDNEPAKDIAFYSKMLKDPKNEKIKNILAGCIGFHYAFSDFADFSQDMRINVPVDMFNAILPQIDNSIEKVVGLTTNDEKIKTNSYLILFKNGDQITIPDNDLSKADRERLSHGTYEVLSFLSVMNEIRQRENDIIFIDEKLAHLHSELEAYLVMKMFFLKNASQVFFTSHNNLLLDLNLPRTAYLLFKRDDASNSAMFVSDTHIKSTDDLRMYYENDYFNILPDYSDLDTYFEDMNHENR